MLCLLDLIFHAVRGHSASIVLRLSKELRCELFLLSLIGPLAVSDLRCTVSQHVYAVDASSRTIAVCSSTLDKAIANEVFRHVNIKGRWTRILSKSSEWLKSHELLEPSDELPGGQTFHASPIWSDVVRSTRFECERVFNYPLSTHINICELRAYLCAEAIHGRHSLATRFSIIGDSSVTSGCVTKGRSSSVALNVELCAGLPNVLGYGLYSGSAFCRSAENVVDDPTRDKAARDPSIEQPP